MVRANLDWITVNMALAAFPFMLSVWLFWSPRSKTAGWWVGVITFVAFLPNAPYVLTDVIHLRADLASASGREAVALMVEYGALFALGLLCYVGAIGIMRRRMEADGHGDWRWPVELTLHGLSSVGIFLGRFLRLNSWDIVARPSAVLQYARVPHVSTVAIIAFTFCVLMTASLMSRVPVAIHEVRHPRR